MSRMPKNAGGTNIPSLPVALVAALALAFAALVLVLWGAVCLIVGISAIIGSAPEVLLAPMPEIALFPRIALGLMLLSLAALSIYLGFFAARYMSYFFRCATFALGGARGNLAAPLSPGYITRKRYLRAMLVALALAVVFGAGAAFGLVQTGGSELLSETLGWLFDLRL